MTITERIYRSLTGERQMAVLVDPDKTNRPQLARLARTAMECGIDYFFAGGSIVFGSVNTVIRQLKDQCDIPVVLFPGNVMQVSEYADAILFLSLISGRNPEFLIGHRVLAAPAIRQAGIEVIPAGYMLIENGSTTSVEYMSSTTPIPGNKPDIAVATAMAGEMLGLKVIYLEAGSGAARPVGLEMIREVRSSVKLPLLAGGGIRTPGEITGVFDAGANLAVIGTAAEENPDILYEMSLARKLITRQSETRQ